MRQSVVFYEAIMTTSYAQWVSQPWEWNASVSGCFSLRVNSSIKHLEGECVPIEVFNHLLGNFALVTIIGEFSSAAQSCPTLCNPMNRSTPGLPVHHHLPDFTQTHVHRVGDAIQPSHPLSSTFPPAPNPSQHQSLFQWVNSAHEVAKVLEFQL